MNSSPSRPWVRFAVSEEVLVRARAHVGADGESWRRRIAILGAERLPCPVEEGGPWIRDGVVSVDPRLSHAAGVALELLAHDAGRRSPLVRGDVVRLLDALTDAAHAQGENPAHAQRRTSQPMS